MARQPWYRSAWDESLVIIRIPIGGRGNVHLHLPDSKLDQEEGRKYGNVGGGGEIHLVSTPVGQQERIDPREA